MSGNRAWARAALLLACAAPASGARVVRALSRRHVTAAAAAATSHCVPVWADTPPSDADSEQLLYAAITLDRALGEWQKQIALVQLGKPGVLQTRELLPDKTVDRLTKRPGADAGATKDAAKHSASLLTYLFLASGATKYESTQQGLKYMDLARAEAEAMRKDIATVAASIDLAIPAAPAAGQPADGSATLTPTAS